MLDTAEPFRLTSQMEQEIDAEITALTTYGKEPHDPARTRPRSVSIRRRNGGMSDSGSITPRSQDDTQVPTAIEDDPINPQHYRSHPSGIECIEVTRHMNFNVGNAIKYLWRYMDKGDPVENLKKAQWYLEDEIKRLTKANGE